MTPPQTVAEWIAEMRAAEAAMTSAPWETYRPWPDMTYERIGARKDVGVMPLRSVNASGDLDVGNVRGIVAARNSLRRMVDVIAQAKRVSVASAGLFPDLDASLAALLVRP